jgi:hypothetical protein
MPSTILSLQLSVDLSRITKALTARKCSRAKTRGNSDRADPGHLVTAPLCTHAGAGYYPAYECAGRMEYHGWQMQACRLVVVKVTIEARHGRPWLMTHSKSCTHRAQARRLLEGFQQANRQLIYRPGDRSSTWHRNCEEPRRPLSTGSGRFRDPASPWHLRHLMRGRHVLIQVVHDPERTADE